MPTMGQSAVEARCAIVRVESRVERVHPLDAAAINDHHHLCAGCATGRHHVMQIVPKLLRVTMRYTTREVPY